MPLIARIGHEPGDEKEARRVLRENGASHVRPAGRTKDENYLVEGLFPGLHNPNGAKADLLSQSLSEDTGDAKMWLDEIEQAPKGTSFFERVKHRDGPKVVYVVRILGADAFVGSFGYPGTSEPLYVQASLQNADYWDTLKEAQDMVETLEENGIEADDCNKAISEPVLEVWKMRMTEVREAWTCTRAL